MKRLSKGTQFALFAFLFIGLVAVLFGFYDRVTEGSAPGVFPFAGAMFLIAGLIYFLGRKTDIVPAVALLLLAAGATSCATGVDLATDQQREALTAATVDSLYKTTSYEIEGGYTQTVAARQTWK